MQIIEEIKKNELISNPSEIQKICLDKLKLNPLPNIKSEYWRLSNKSKFSSFLDHSNKNKESKVNLPYKKASQNIIRLIIGDNNSINLEKENYSIKELKEIEIVDYIKKYNNSKDYYDDSLIKSLKYFLSCAQGNNSLSKNMYEKSIQSNKVLFV